jgi:hypothetical protein
MLTLNKDNVYLSDMRSKFGIGIYVNKPIRVSPEKGFNVQTGRTIMYFSISNNKCCGR